MSSVPENQENLEVAQNDYSPNSNNEIKNEEMNFDEV